MRKLLVISALIFFSSLNASAGVSVDVGGGYDDGYYYYDDDWYGPGWYYGVYFDDEPGYYGWRRRYPYYRGYYNSWGHRGGRWHGGHWHGGHHH